MSVIVESPLNISRRIFAPVLGVFDLKRHFQWLSSFFASSELLVFICDAHRDPL